MEQTERNEEKSDALFLLNNRLADTFPLALPRRWPFISTGSPWTYRQAAFVIATPGH